MNGFLKFIMLATAFFASMYYFHPELFSKETYTKIVEARKPRETADTYWITQKDSSYICATVSKMKGPLKSIQVPSGVTVRYSQKVESYSTIRGKQYPNYVFAPVKKIRIVN